MVVPQISHVKGLHGGTKFLPVPDKNDTQDLFISESFFVTLCAF